MKQESAHSRDEELLTIRDACFSILYILLKHFLLSILFLMAIWSLVKLPMTDEHLRRVIQREDDLLILSSRVNQTTEHNIPLSPTSLPGSQQHRPPVSRFPGDEEEELVYQKLKVIVVMARIIVILVIFFGILGIIKENVNLLLVFVVFMAFRLLTTVYVPYFSSGLISNAALLAITILSVIFSICLIHYKKQVACLSASTLSLSSISTSSPVSSSSSPASCDSSLSVSTNGSAIHSVSGLKHLDPKQIPPPQIIVNRA